MWITSDSRKPFEVVHVKQRWSETAPPGVILREEVRLQHPLSNALMPATVRFVPHQGVSVAYD